jgi:hypothetical protein
MALQLALGRNRTGRACQRSQVGMEAVGRKVEVRGRGLEVGENVGMLERRLWDGESRQSSRC